MNFLQGITSILNSLQILENEIEEKYGIECQLDIMVRSNETNTPILINNLFLEITMYSNNNIWAVVTYDFESNVITYFSDVEEQLSLEHFKDTYLDRLKSLLLEYKKVTTSIITPAPTITI